MGRYPPFLDDKDTKLKEYEVITLGDSAAAWKSFLPRLINRRWCRSFCKNDIVVLEEEGFDDSSLESLEKDFAEATLDRRSRFETRGPSETIVTRFYQPWSRS
jgi:hypothetical protein